MDVTVMSGVTDGRNTVPVLMAICVCFFLFYNSICSGIRFSNIWANFVLYSYCLPHIL